MRYLHAIQVEMFLVRQLLEIWYVLWYTGILVYTYEVPSVSRITYLHLVLPQCVHSRSTTFVHDSFADSLIQRFIYIQRRFYCAYVSSELPILKKKTKPHHTYNSYSSDNFWWRRDSSPQPPEIFFLWSYFLRTRIYKVNLFSVKRFKMVRLLMLVLVSDE